MSRKRRGWWLVAGCRLLVVDSWWFVVGGRRMVVGSRKKVVGD